MQPRLAIFAATSGHSGVDRNLRNLVPAFIEQGIAVDLLKVRHHGPHLDAGIPGLRVVDLGAAHVATSLPAVVRYLKDHRPNALLADKDKVNRTALIARRLAGVSTRVGVRLGIHVSTNLASRGAWQRFLQTQSIRRFYPGADAIVVPSEGVADDLAALGRLDRKRISVIPNPVLTASFRAKLSEPVDHPWFADDGIPVVLGVGELGARKDFGSVLRAVAKVRQQDRVRLLLLGKGRQRDALLKLGASLGFGDDLQLPGFAENPYALMARASVFVNASRYEGFANVVAEALAAGIPVVATDCPSGPREILADGQFGQLVPVGDVDALAAAITDTLTNPPDRARQQQAAQRYALEPIATSYLRALKLVD